MKQYLSIGIGCLIWAASCQKRNDNRTEATTSQTDSMAIATQQSVASCYGYTSARDTIQLRLVPQGDSLTGELIYKLAEKDRNTGTLRGQMQGDTLLARYTFQSEGTESVREVIFLRQANALVEGYGPVAEQNGQMVFTDRSKLRFDATWRLSPADCPR